MSRSTLPPLPKGLKTSGMVTEKFVDRPGVRIGSALFAGLLVLLSLCAIFVGLTSDGRDLRTAAIGGAVVAVVLLSGLASGGWRDVPLSGGRRILADLPILGTLFVIAAGCLWGLAHFVMVVFEVGSRTGAFGIAVLVVFLGAAAITRVFHINPFMFLARSTQMPAGTYFNPIGQDIIPGPDLGGPPTDRHRHR